MIIGLAIASLLVMPFLSWAQRRTGKALGSNAVVADGTQTLMGTYLSAVLLVGLLLDMLLGWSWADPLAALVIAGVAVREGLEAWRGEGCCGHTGRSDAPEPSAERDSCCKSREQSTAASGCDCRDEDGRG